MGIPSAMPSPRFGGGGGSTTVTRSARVPARRQLRPHAICRQSSWTSWDQLCRGRMAVPPRPGPAGHPACRETGTKPRTGALVRRRVVRLTSSPGLRPPVSAVPMQPFSGPSSEQAVEGRADGAASQPVDQEEWRAYDVTKVISNHDPDEDVEAGGAPGRESSEQALVHPVSPDPAPVGESEERLSPDVGHGDEADQGKEEQDPGPTGLQKVA